MPLVLETDVLPFPTLNPVEWMIRGDWYMKAGEIDQAQKYYGQAASWLKSQEVVKETTQTSLVVNSVFENSMGQLSAESVNI
jgi:Tfp pilus assembly protein PilF